MRKNELSCYFFNSVGDIMIHFLVYLVVKVIILGIAKLLLNSILSILDKEQEEIARIQANNNYIPQKPRNGLRMAKGAKTSENEQN